MLSSFRYSCSSFFPSIDFYCLSSLSSSFFYAFLGESKSASSSSILFFSASSKTFWNFYSTSWIISYFFLSHFYLMASVSFGTTFLAISCCFFIVSKFFSFLNSRSNVYFIDNDIILRWLYLFLGAEEYISYHIIPKRLLFHLSHQQRLAYLLGLRGLANHPTNCWCLILDRLRERRILCDYMLSRFNGSRNPSNPSNHPVNFLKFIYSSC